MPTFAGMTIFFYSEYLMCAAAKNFMTPIICVSHHSTAASRKESEHCVASMAARIPIGTVSFRATCPYTSPVRIGFERGERWSAMISSTVRNGFAVSDGLMSVNSPTTMPFTSLNIPARASWFIMRSNR